MAFYNKKPSDTGYKAIIKLLTPETSKKTKEKEDTEAKIKGYKKLQKKEVKKEKEDKKAKAAESVKKDIMEELEEVIENDKSNIAKVEEILAKFKEVKVPEPVATPTPTKREY